MLFGLGGLRRDRVLEVQGLVEIQHSSPQQFRAVSVAEATGTLRGQYETRVDRLHNALEPASRWSAARLAASPLAHSEALATLAPRASR
jgi:sugar-specific transcriptional regulator TrmB